MDSSKNKIYFVIILALIIVILLQKCGGNINPVTSTNDTIRTIDTTYSIVTKEVKTYVPKWHTKTEYVHDTTRIIDTAYVIGDYYSTYSYQDSLITDTLKLYINDSITQNKIKSRDLKYKMVFPTVHITDVIIKNKWNFILHKKRTN